eukprot:13389507-Alexandrium_andersonii.AAC.1
MPLPCVRGSPGLCSARPRGQSCTICSRMPGRRAGSASAAGAERVCPSPAPLALLARRYAVRQLGHARTWQSGPTPRAGGE